MYVCNKLIYQNNNIIEQNIRSTSFTMYLHVFISDNM